MSVFASKPPASLSSGLLARKGQARPAMRPQPISFDKGSIEDDLGWNDMGFDAPAADHAADSTPVPLVLVERATLKREIETSREPANLVSPATAERLARESAALTKGRKAAFTLRLDAGRHLRLRLAAALAGRSAQMLVTEALDAFLQIQPGLDALVDGLAPSARKRD